MVIKHSSVLAQESSRSTPNISSLSSEGEHAVESSVTFTGFLQKQICHDFWFSDQLPKNPLQELTYRRKHKSLGDTC